MPLAKPTLFAMDDPEQTKQLVRHGQADLARSLRHLDAGVLADDASAYLCGPTMTIADLAVGSALMMLSHPAVQIDLAPFPRVQSWLARCTASSTWIGLPPSS
ncbi:Glutathione S-transferase [Plasmodiophora brassicae]